jgi:hypothetical protein
MVNQISFRVRPRQGAIDPSRQPVIPTKVVPAKAHGMALREGHHPVRARKVIAVRRWPQIAPFKLMPGRQRIEVLRDERSQARVL